MPYKENYTKIIVENEDRARQIITLDVKAHPISSIEGVEKLSELSEVWCHSRNISSLRWIEKLPKLYLVWLRYDETVEWEIPSWLIEIKTLKRIVAREGIYLQRIRFDTSQPLDRLEERTNLELESIGSKTTNLVELQLNKCDIRSLPDDFFYHPWEGVDLRDNKC